MNVRVFLRRVGLLSTLALFASCSSKTKAPLDPSTRLVHAELDAATGLLAAPRSGGLGAFEARDLTGGGARFFPLDSGSVWIYAREARSVLLLPSAPPDTLADSSTVITRMLGKQDFGGTLYTLSTETALRDERELVSQIFYRQDATGLYELDALIRDPASRVRVAPMHAALSARIVRGTPAKDLAAMQRALAIVEARIARIDGLLHSARPIPSTGPQGQPEIQRLAYPLYAGREWILRADPLFTERVEARESIIVGGRRLTGWRIRIESELFGPDDRVWLTYSHEGELRFRYHVESPAADDTGNIVGTIVTDQDQRLVEYHLAGATSTGGPFTGSPFGGQAARRETPNTR